MRNRSNLSGLRKVPSGMILLLATFFLFSASALYGQSVTVSGTVSDESGMTLPGVSIRVVGTTNGSITNANGAYDIKVSGPAAVLKFSYIGYDTQDVTVGSNITINVTMVEGLELEEVVVTAMGITREEKSLGYAMQQINAEELNAGGDISTISALSGKVAGVQITSATTGVDGTPRVLIRGINSLSNDNQPLFVIDGIPVSSSQNSGIGAINFSSIGQVNDFGSPISDINPNDIESVSILKGASATALYGSRASNGVIFITTKKASKSSQGIGVSINSMVTIQNPLYTPEYQTEYGWGSNGTFDDWEMGGVAWGPPLDQGLEFPQYNSPIDPVTGERQATPWTSHGNNYDNYFETGSVISNNVALTAAGEKARARFSYTNINQNDMIPNINMQKNTFQMNSTLDLSDRLSFDVISTYSNTVSPNRTSGTGEGIMAALLYMPASVDVLDLKDHLDINGNSRSFHPHEINPYYVVRESQYPVNRQRFSGKVNAHYKFTDWMKLRVGVSRDQTLSISKSKVNINYIPDFWGNSDGYFSNSQSFIAENNADFLLQIDKSFTKDESFRVSLYLGGNLMSIDQQSTNVNTVGGLVQYGEYNLNNSKLTPEGNTWNSQKNLNSLYAQAIFSYKDYAFIELTGRNDWTSTLPPEAWSYFYPSVTGSFIFTEAFNIKPEVMSFGKIRANWARVGSDTSPYNLIRYADRASNWTSSIMPYYYNDLIPPVGLMPEFNTTAELGLVLNFLNNRLNFDLAVYDAVIENQILQVPTASSRGFTSELVNIGVMQNRGVEVVIEAMPVQSEHFSWKVTGNWSSNNTALLEYIDRASYREISSFGGGNVYAPNISYYSQLQEDLDDGVVSREDLNYIDRYLMENGRYGDIFGSYYLRDDDGSIMTEDGYPIHSGQASYQNYFADSISGEIREKGYLNANTQPDFLAGIRNEFRYKQFGIAFLFDCSWGGTFISHHYMERIKNGVDILTVGKNDKGNPIRNDVVKNDDGVTYADNTGGIKIEGIDINTGEPNEIYLDAEYYLDERRDFPTEASLISGTYIKLRELSITYSLPTSLLSKAKITRASISLVGNNLLLFHGFEDVPDYFGITTDAKIKAPFDPESSMGAGNSGVGVEYGSLPSPRTIGISLSVNF